MELGLATPSPAPIVLFSHDSIRSRITTTEKYWQNSISICCMHKAFRTAPLIVGFLVFSKLNCVVREYRYRLLCWNSLILFSFKIKYLYLLRQLDLRKSRPGLSLWRTCRLTRVKKIWRAQSMVHWLPDFLLSRILGNSEGNLFPIILSLVLGITLNCLHRVIFYRNLALLWSATRRPTKLRERVWEAWLWENVQLVRRMENGQ